MNSNQGLIRSQYVRSLQRGERAVIWHSLFGNPQVVSTSALSLLERFAETTSIEQLAGSELEGGWEEVVQVLIGQHFLNPPEYDEREVLAQRMCESEKTIVDGSRISNLSLIVCEACNFCCTYCIHFNNLGKSERLNSSTKKMSFAVAKRAIDFFVAHLDKIGRQDAEINFGGGEPLLNWSLIKEVLRYCEEAYGKRKLRFSINTNASMMTLEIAKVLKQYKVQVATSLDGLLEGNDLVRLARNGQGTFELIVAGWDRLAAAGYPATGFSVTCNAANFPLIHEKLIDWAIDRGMRDLRIDPDVIGMIAIPVDEVVAKLMHLKRYAESRGASLTGFWERPIENMNDSVLDTDVAFCGAARGSGICVSPVGEMYACGYSTTKLGNINKLDEFFKPQSGYFHFVVEHQTGFTKMCRSCSIEGQCAGGCQITREFALAEPMVNVDRRCEFYRNITEQLLAEALESEVD